MRLITLFLLLSQFTFAQNFEFINLFLDNQSRGFINCDSDAAGNLFVAGTIQGEVDIDPGVNEDILISEKQSLFVAKYTPAGDLFWIKTIGDDCSAKDIHVDANGDLLVVGDFHGLINFGTSDTDFFLETGDNRWGYVLKLDGEGNTLAAKRFRSGPWNSDATIVKTDANNNIIIGGTYSGKLDIDLNDDQINNMPNANAPDAFLVKYDSNFQVEWGESIGGNDGRVLISDLVIDQNGAIYALGAFRQEIDFDEGDDIPAYGEYDVFLAKHPPNGNTWDWHRTYGGTKNDSATAIEFAETENAVWIGGDFEELANFYLLDTPMELATPIQDGFLVKVDADGTTLATQQLNGETSGYVQSLEKDANGNLVILGGFGGSLNMPDTALDQDLTTDSLHALFIGTLNENGELATAKKYAEGDYFQYSLLFHDFVTNESLLLNEDGSIIFSGDFATNTLLSLGSTTENIPHFIDFDSPFPSYNSYFIKINDFLLDSQAPILASNPATIFPNPSDGILNIKSVISPASLNVYNNQGQLVKQIPNPKDAVNLMDLPNSIYWIQLEFKNDIIWQKWVKH